MPNGQYGGALYQACAQKDSGRSYLGKTSDPGPDFPSGANAAYQLLGDSPASAVYPTDVGTHRAIL